LPPNDDLYKELTQVGKLVRRLDVLSANRRNGMDARETCADQHVPDVAIKAGRFLQLLQHAQTVDEASIDGDSESPGATASRSSSRT
jgi:hypothetical protein